MLLSFVYFAMRCLLRALVRSGRDDLEREVELLVLRHQLKVLSRGARRPPFRRRDRMLAPLPVGSSRAIGGRRSSWLLGLCSGGTGSWSDASGRTGAADQADQGLMRIRWSSSSGWQRRTRGGATSGSEGSC